MATAVIHTNELNSFCPQDLDSVLTIREMRVNDTVRNAIASFSQASKEMRQSEEYAELNADVSEYSVNPQAICEPFSELLGQRVRYMDIFALFFDILRLYVKEHQFISDMRRLAMLDQISNMEKAVNELRDQGKWSLLTGIGSGLMGIVGGVMQSGILGDSIFNALSGQFKALQNTTASKFYKSGATICDAMSKMYSSTNSTHESYSKASQNRFEFNKEKAKMESDEELSRRNEINQNFRELKEAIKRAMEDQQQADQQLFRVAG